MTDVVYHGIVSPEDGDAVVYTGGPLTDRKRGALPYRFDLRNHSPDGFSWGYNGSGPAQLALAMVAHATGDDELALATYQQFKDEVVSRFERGKPWSMTALSVVEAARRIADTRRARHFSWGAGDVQILSGDDK